LGVGSPEMKITAEYSGSVFNLSNTVSVHVPALLNAKLLEDSLLLGFLIEYLVVFLQAIAF